MIKSPIGQLNLDAMTNAFKDLELQLDADVLVFFGEIVDGIEANIKQIVEQICKSMINCAFYLLRLAEV